MKSYIFLFSISLFLFKGAFAQTPDTLWSKVLTGFIGYSVQQTSDEGYIIAGTSSQLFGDALLIKTNSSGDTVWTNTYGAGVFRSVKQTTDDGFIATGQTTSGTEDIPILKTDSLGEVLWTKTYGGTRIDWASDVKQTYDGGYIIVGSTNSFAFPNGQLWLLKTDSNGDTLWTKFFGGQSMYNIGTSVCQARDSGYVVTGYTLGTGNSIDLWLIKTNNNGDLVWMKTYGGMGWDQGNSVQQTENDGYIIVGEKESFGSGNSDVWLIKTDPIGDTIWTHTYGGVDLDKGNSVQQTNDNGYIIAGSSEPFGPGNFDLLLIKTDSNGDTLWTSIYGGIDSDEGYSVRQTTDNGYIVSGYTFSNGSFGKFVWLLKISSDPSDVEDRQVFQPQEFILFQNYPNPFNPSTKIKFVIPKSSFITLIVYDVLGKEAAILVNEETPAGNHEVEFNATALPSGIYFYQLKAGSFIQTKKMIIVK